MYKLVVFFCLFAVTFAGYLEPAVKTISVHSEVPVVKTALVHEPATVAVHEQTLAKVGEHVEHIPTSVSHHSSSVVHSKADVITPILAQGVKTRYEPTIRTYEKQYIENVPVVSSYVAPTVVKSYSAPALVKSYAAPSVYKSYSPSVYSSYTPSVYKSYAPSVYSSYAPSVYKSYAPSVYSSYSPSVYGSHSPLTYSASSYHHSHAPVVSSW